MVVAGQPRAEPAGAAAVRVPAGSAAQCGVRRGGPLPGAAGLLHPLLPNQVSPMNPTVSF